MKVAIIVARDYITSGIGYNGQLQWHNKDDMKWFKSITIGSGNNAVIMGKTTYDSLPTEGLGGRMNIVITHHPEEISDRIFTADSVINAIKQAKEHKCENAFIIGGESIYKQALEIEPGPDHYEVDTIYITEIINDKKLKFDKFFDKSLLTNFSKDLFMSLHYWEKYFNCNENNRLIVFRRNYYSNHIKYKNYTESQYFELLEKILTEGQTKHTRAGDTLSVFGEMMRFNIKDSLPILTSKKVYAKGCIHELLWFLKGGTNIKYLVENNTHIWDDDAYRYFLQNILPYSPGMIHLSMSKEEFISHVLDGSTISYSHPDTKDICLYTFGDLGPVYGKQWTNWNGINQIDELIHKLKTNPDDRRLMISAWNVGELKDMALPPCHYLSQWYTTEIPEKERYEYTDKTKEYTMEEMNEMNIPKYYLSCMWSQRSVDMCLGFPYDLLSYSVFVYLIASQCNMIPYELICTLGDCHIYKNQIESTYIQLDRNYNKFKNPKLIIDKKDSIYDYTYNDIHIENYESYPSVKYKLSVGL